MSKAEARYEYRAPMGKVRMPTFPFEITNLDICGPYHRSQSGNRFLLTFLDQFSKYAEAIPIPNTSAEVCVRANVTHIIARYGTGSILVTEQGTSFTSVFFRETCRIFGIKELHLSPLHPQANGAAEKYHKTMNQGLSHYLNASGTKWDTLIPLYLMAYRATPHGSTGFSPYYLLHG